MNMEVYAIQDMTLGVYMRPMFFSNKGQALRSFSDLCADKEGMIFRHPESFALYLIGSWDDKSGFFTSDKVTHIANAADFVVKDSVLVPLDILDRLLKTVEGIKK